MMSKDNPFSNAPFENSVPLTSSGNKSEDKNITTLFPNKTISNKDNQPESIDLRDEKYDLSKPRRNVIRGSIIGS